MPMLDTAKKMDWGINMQNENNKSGYLKTPSVLAGWWPKPVKWMVNCTAGTQYFDKESDAQDYFNLWEYAKMTALYTPACAPIFSYNESKTKREIDDQAKFAFSVQEIIGRHFDCDDMKAEEWDKLLDAIIAKSELMKPYPPPVADLAALERARDAVSYWQQCRANFSKTQNRTEYDQAALDVMTGSHQTIRALLDQAIAAQKVV